MSNRKKEVIEYYQSVKNKFKNDVEFIEDINKTIADLKLDGGGNINQIKFYNQLKRYLTPKDEAIGIIEKAFGKQIKFPNKELNWGKVWSVNSKSNYVGYFIIENKDKTFSFVYRVELSDTFDIEVFLTLPFNQVEKFVKYVKREIKKLTKV